MAVSANGIFYSNLKENVNLHQVEFSGESYLLSKNINYNLANNYRNQNYSRI